MSDNKLTNALYLLGIETGDLGIASLMDDAVAYIATLESLVIDIKIAQADAIMDARKHNVAKMRLIGSAYGSGHCMQDLQERERKLRLL